MKSTLLLASSLVATTLASAEVTQTIEETHPFKRDAVVRVSNINGSIDITTWDKEEVSIVAVKKGKTQEDLDRITVIIEARSDRLVIDTKHERGAWWQFWKNSTNGGVNYTLRVPAAVTLEEIETVNSGVKIDGVTGTVRAKTVNGSVELRGLAATASLETVNGRVVAEFVRVPDDARINLESVNGACEITLPSDANAHINASTVNGGIHSDLPITTTKSTKRSLEGTLGSGGARIALSTVNGGVQIRGR